MKGKTLLSVLLPATRKTYDFWVPSDMTFHDACTLIAGILESREAYRYEQVSGNALMSHETGAMFDPCRTVSDAGLVNGSRLVLV